MTTFLFPGQGSQKKGMGEQLFKQYPQLVKTADEILGYSIEELCLSDPFNHLNQTEYTQPAIFIINILYYIDYLKTQADFPDFLLGHSLGEYNALFAAHVFDFATGLQIVQKRAQLMGQAKEGGMLAVIGLSMESIQEVLSHPKLNLLSIANINSYKQIVISGDVLQIPIAATMLQEVGASMCIPLKVSGAFHSPYMHEMSLLFAEFLDDFHFKKPTKTIIANVTAKPYEAEDMKTLLVQQIESPVQWLKSMEYVRKQGETQFIELGEGKTLTNINDRIEKQQ